jgi:hypothetical protein
VHTFKWQYTKDGNTSHGSDCGWVDYIIFPPSVVPIEITTDLVPDWTIGIPYSEQLIASGGSGPHTWSDLYSDLDGTGLTLSSTGLLSGTPSATGTISFTAHVEDNAGATDERLFSFSVNDIPEITTLSVPDWTAGTVYSQQLESTGGTGSLIWTDQGGDLAGSGLTLSSPGILSGTPTIVGDYSFTAHLEDDAGAYDDVPYDFTINAELVISEITLPDWTAGVFYSEQLTSTGGTGSIEWSELGNNLAGTGLSLSASGLVSGIPFSAAAISFTAYVEDDIGADDSEPVSFTVNPAPEVTTASLADGTVGEAYSTQLESTGGTGDLAWSDKNSDLDGSGLTLSATGLLSGTPLAASTINLTVEIEDEVGATADKPLSLTILNAWVCGDADASSEVDIDDVVFLIAYVFTGGPAPDPLESADADCSGDVDIDDIVYLIAHIFTAGPEPCAEC